MRKQCTHLNNLACAGWWCIS